MPRTGELLGEVAAGLMLRRVPAASPQEALAHVVDRAVAGDTGRPPVASVAEGQLVRSERPHRAWTGRRRGLAPPPTPRDLSEELRNEGGGVATAHEVPRRALAEELREPRLVLDLLVQDRQREVVGAVVLAGRQVTDVRVAAHRATLCLCLLSTS